MDMSIKPLRENENIIGYLIRKSWEGMNYENIITLVERLKNFARYSMDCVFETYLNEEVDDIPKGTKEPVWILGRNYHATQDLVTIRHDILSRLWFTYRKNFVAIGDTGLTSDRGWGCMLRCGQMVLAQALVLLHLGRDWLWELETKDTTYLKILRKFEDNRQAPFSIHQIALMGISQNKNVGEWFGPNTVAQVLKKLIVYDSWCSITVHVALDNAVIINEIKEQCLKSETDSTNLVKDDWKPLLLIVPLRLGINEINPVYISAIQKSFTFKQSLGIIGGKPNLALYFIGCVGQELIFLDPHTTQRTGLVENKETADQIELDKTYHCSRASRVHINSLDPSVALCFFCQTEEEFDDLCISIKTELLDLESTPLFEMCYDRPKAWTSTEVDLPETQLDAFYFDPITGAKLYDSDEFEVV